MPKAPGKPKRGRKFKFNLGDVVRHDTLGWGVVVDRKIFAGDVVYKYRFVRLHGPYPNSRAYGKAGWHSTHHMHKAKEGEVGYNLRRPNVLVTYRANKRLEEIEPRGCRCECCVHTAIPTNQITKDGRFKWELEVEESDDE